MDKNEDQEKNCSQGLSDDTEKSFLMEPLNESDLGQDKSTNFPVESSNQILSIHSLPINFETNSSEKENSFPIQQTYFQSNKSLSPIITSIPNSISGNKENLGDPKPKLPQENRIGNRIDLDESEKSSSKIGDLTSDSPLQSSLTRVQISKINDKFQKVLEVLILFVIAILVFRAILLEPYGVPTGSMAPTLTGDHFLVHCPECGIPIRYSRPINSTLAKPAKMGENNTNGETCSNCGFNFSLPRKLSTVSGDRLLVDKNVFSLRAPRRYEVVVFWCPVDSSKPYVKRVLGLPGEAITIHDGDIWIDNMLLRKNYAECQTLRIPICTFDHFPKSCGWNYRWQIVPPANSQTPIISPQSDPENAALIQQSNQSVFFRIQEGTIFLNDVQTISSGKHPHDIKEIEYLQKEIPSIKPPSPENSQEHTRANAYANAFMESTNSNEIPISDWFIYNQSQGEPQYVHDFAVSFDLNIDRGEGCFSCSLTDGDDRINCFFPIGTNNPSFRLIQNDGEIVREQNNSPLELNHTYHCEIFFFDRRFMVFLNGKEIVRPLDLPPKPNRHPVSRPLRFGVLGTAVSVHHLTMFRDIHYRSLGNNGTNFPFFIPDKQYFMLGDNSSNSEDSRYWRIPGVSEDKIFGKPFFLHQPNRANSFSIGSSHFEFQMIDWARIGWIH